MEKTSDGALAPYETIRLEAREGGAYVLTLDRPSAMNALCRKTNEELLGAFALLERLAAGPARDAAGAPAGAAAEGAAAEGAAAEGAAVSGDGAAWPQARVLILTGGPKAFAAGADIGEMLGAGPREAAGTSALGHRVHDALEALPIPTVAAVCGPALGGGLELALACDFRVAGEGAAFGLPEAGLGILPGAGGTQRLPPLVGLAVAREMVLLGRRLTGAEAAALGLANRCVPDEAVMGEALAMAARLARCPACALALAKQALNAGAMGTPREGLARERDLFALAFSTRDAREGLAAFAEKRRPAYTHSW
jgi:enoyl-CoA hydratase